MGGLGRVGFSMKGEALEVGLPTAAMAEHAAVSRSPLARGLKQVNTDLMSVPTRYGNRRKGKGRPKTDMA